MEKTRAPNPTAAVSELWNLRYYVAGHTPKPPAAVSNLEEICDRHLKGGFRLEVVDLMKNPQLAAGDQIIAIPTLVWRLPTPLKGSSGIFPRPSAPW